jgi:hypothetical protein
MDYHIERHGNGALYCITLWTGYPPGLGNSSAGSRGTTWRAFRANLHPLLRHTRHSSMRE